MDQPHPVAAVGLVEIGGGDEDGYPFSQELVEDAPEVAARHRIDAIGRLVEEEDLRRVDQGAGKAELLLHPAGEIARLAPFERRQVAEGKEPLYFFGTPFLRHAVDVGVEVDVLHHGQVGIEAEALAHVADLFLDRLGLPDRVPPHDPGFAGGRVHDGGEQAHGGGLAGAVRPDQAEDLPLATVRLRPSTAGRSLKRLVRLSVFMTGSGAIISRSPVPRPQSR